MNEHGKLTDVPVASLTEFLGKADMIVGDDDIEITIKITNPNVTTPVLNLVKNGIDLHHLVLDFAFTPAVPSSERR